MAAKTGSTYIFGTSVDSVEILTANLRFSTVTSSQKVPLEGCDDDRQAELATWPHKPEVRISLAL